MKTSPHESCQPPGGGLWWQREVCLDVVERVVVLRCVWQRQREEALKGDDDTQEEEEKKKKFLPPGRALPWRRREELSRLEPPLAEALRQP